MSTYLYLVCPHHEEPVQADEESGQHYYDLPQIRFDWLRRDHWMSYIDRFPDTLSRDWDHLAYFSRNTFRFLREHRECGTPYIETEYGDQLPVESATLYELLSESPA